MSEDIKTNTLIMVVVVGLLGLVGFWVHDCNKTEIAKGCRDSVECPAVQGGNIKCPDLRQKMSNPPGWTCAKCECEK